MLSYNSTIFLPAFASISSGKARVVILPRRELLLLHHLTVIHLSSVQPTITSPSVLISSGTYHCWGEKWTEPFFPQASAQCTITSKTVRSRALSSCGGLQPVSVNHPTSPSNSSGVTFWRRTNYLFQAVRQLHHLWRKTNFPFSSSEVTPTSLTKDKLPIFQAARQLRHL